jgi:hypothetical protein
MRAATIVLIFYATTMVCGGALEMGHDLLHYLAEHYHSTLHDHEHGHHHTVHDHEHGHDHHAEVSHHHDADHEAPQSRALPIQFFLYVQSVPEFAFYNLLPSGAYTRFRADVTPCFLQPSTPPPELA